MAERRWICDECGAETADGPICDPCWARIEPGFLQALKDEGLDDESMDENDCDEGDW